MSKALIAGINQVAIDKGLDREVIFDAIEAALISAYKRNYGSVANVSAEVDRVNGNMRVLTEREVVEDVMNERTEILLDAAKTVESEAELGDVIKVETKPDDFGRIAAQTAKQVILQRIREAERDIVYENFVHRVGEVISAQVRSVDNLSGALTVLLDDKHECLIMREDCIASERLRRGDYIKVLVADIHKSTRGPVIKLSRTHKDLLRRLLEQEIPEIRDGLVEIKDIAREPGARSKAAVFATRPNIDPVGSCVGMRGLRIQNVVNELGGEKIDVVEWSSEPFNYISNALSPAKVSSVYLDEAGSLKTAIVVVPDRQLSLAIGKAGQNARLAAKLTGWRIDIKSETESIAEGLDKKIDAQQSAVKDKDGDLLSRVEELLRQDDPNKVADEAVDKLAEAARQIEEGLLQPSDALDTETPSLPTLEELNQMALSNKAKDEESSFMSLEEAAAAIADASSFSENFPVFEPEATEDAMREEFLSNKEQDDSSQQAEGESAEDLPEMITADMLRARMEQRKTADEELEIPAELLVGLEDENDEPKKKLKSKKSKAKKAESKKKSKSKSKAEKSDDGLSDFF
mgnify:CR=1 FL=1